MDANDLIARYEEFPLIKLAKKLKAEENSAALGQLFWLFPLIKLAKKLKEVL